jgi:DNA-binding beta-propeller fold protein YncE
MRCLFGKALLVAILATGCTANSVIEPFSESLRRWPEGPDIARIEMVGEFASAAELSIGGGFWAKLVSIAVGSKDGTMIRPMAVVATDKGRMIIVADPDAGCVHRFDIGKGRYHCLAPRSGDGTVAPIGLAITSDGQLFVADSERGVIWQAESSADKYLKQFHVSAALQQPTGLFWDEAGQSLYVTDTKAQAVLLFDRQGGLKRVIGEGGGGPGQFNYPTYVWRDSELGVFVADTLNFRIQIFTPSGDYYSEFGAGGDQPGDFSRPKGVAIDSMGNVYVVDALMHTIQILDIQGRLLLAVGEQGQGEGQFWLPNGIFITSDDTIYVADSYNKRVQVFRYVGPRS